MNKIGKLVITRTVTKKIRISSLIYTKAKTIM